MAFDEKTERLISLKKLSGKAHTSNDKGLANEALPGGLTLSSNTVFGQTIPAHTGSATQYHVLSNSSGEGVAEFLRLSASFILGSDTSSGRHGFSLKLPDDYVSNSKNSKKGTDPFIDGRVIYLTTGSLQLVPPSYDLDYEAKPYHTGSGEIQIPVLDSRDWSLDYFNGIFFQQDPDGTGDQATNPRYVDAYLYIGKMTSEIISAVSGENVFKTISVSGQSDVIADSASDTLTLIGAGSTTITTNAGTDTITFTSTGGGSSSTGSFHVPSPGKFVTTASVSFAGAKGFSYTADSIGTDTNFFVSGSMGSKDSSVAGSTVFGGDVVISGTLHGGSPLKIDGGMEVTGTFEMKPKIGTTAIVRNPVGPVKIFAGTNLKLGTGTGIIDLLDLDDGYAGQIMLTGSGGPSERSVELNSPGTLFFTGSASGSYFKGPVSVSNGLTGSLTRLPDGSSYIVAGQGIDVSTGSNGQVTITNQGSGEGDITGVTVSTGLLGGGTSGTVDISIDDSVLATLTGSQFTGDVGIAGTLDVTSGISGSLTRLVDGSSFMVAGKDIKIQSSSNGAIEISSTAVSSVGSLPRSKTIYDISSTHIENTDFSISPLSFATAGHDPGYIDVFINGQLLMSGTALQVSNNEIDYTVVDDSNAKFSFDLTEDDILTVAIFDSGSGSSNSNQNLVMNDLLSGNADGINTCFLLSSSPFSNSSVQVFVNGQMQLIGGLKSWQDYSVTGSSIFFTTASTPPADSIVMATYLES